MDHMRAVVFELRRRRNSKAMPAISITGIHKILPKLIGGNLYQVPVAIPNFDIHCDIRLIFVPNPTTNLLAVRLFDVADMVRKRSGTDAP